MSQPDFLYELFEDFMSDPANEDFSMDNGLVCRWMTGQAKISPKISAYYYSPGNQKKLAETIHQNLLPLMPDCNMAIQDTYTLFMQDDTISDAKKKNLSSLYKPASSRLLFLAKLISFGMERQFIKRDTRNQKLIAGGALSPIVLDHIMDSEVPKPCRHFLGREEELNELHTILEEKHHVFLYGIAGIGKSELAKAYAMLLTEQQEPEKGISILQKLLKVIKKYNSDGCLDYATVQESIGTLYLMTANLPQAKTHFKKALKIYEDVWTDEPELIEEKYQEIQELYLQVGIALA